MKPLRIISKVCFSFLSVLLILPSCVELVSDEFPDFEAQPSLNCILVAGDSLKLQVSMAEKIDSFDLTLVDNASVQVTQGNSAGFLLDYVGSGLYTSPFPVEPGSPYRVSVLIDGYPEVHAYDTVPTPGSVSILSQTNTARLNEEGKFVPGIKLSFTDDPESDNYYELVMYKRSDGSIRLARPFNEQDKILLNEGFEPFSTQSLVFSDELIETEEVSMDLIYSGSFSTFRSGEIRAQTFREHTLIVELRQISREYYKYKKSFYFYENSRYAEFIEGTATSYPIYSNVENGLGIVASYASSHDSIFIEADTVYLSN